MQAVDRDAPSAWRGKFIAYKALKKALKEMKEAPVAEGSSGSGDATPEPGSPAAAGAVSQADSEARFFELLKAELLRVNR